VIVTINRIFEDLLTDMTGSFFDREMLGFEMTIGMLLSTKLATARHTNELSIFLGDPLRGLVN